MSGFGAFLATVLVIAATVNATNVPLSWRQIGDIAEAEGRFQIVRPVSPDGCPQAVLHTSIRTPDVPHRFIRMNGKQCRGAGSMRILADSAEASDVVTGNAEELVTMLTDVESDLDVLIYGFEDLGRDCGTRPDDKLPRNTLVVIVRAKSDPVVGIGFRVRPIYRYMIIAKPNGDQCIYTAPLLPSPDPPLATPPPPMTTPPPMTSPSVDDDGDSGFEPSSPAPESSEVPGSTTEDDDDSSDPDASPSSDLDSDDDDDDGVCFPADATVELEDGSVKLMTEVNVGDRIKVGAGVYSDVFMFSHKMASIRQQFVTLSTTAGDKISATQGHYLYLNGKLTVAGAARVGDIVIRGDGSVARIIDVSREIKTGLYNPQTIHGDIVVNNVRASTFTRTVDVSTAQALLAPLRMVYNAFGFSSKAFDYGANALVPYVPKGGVVRS